MVVVWCDVPDTSSLCRQEVSSLRRQIAVHKLTCLGEKRADVGHRLTWLSEVI